MNALPFTAEQFFAVFARYNLAVWPAQLLLTAIAIALIPVARSGWPGAGRLVSFGLALLWAWMGIVYHMGFFRVINPAALLFGLLFLLQAGLLLWSGVWRGRVIFVRRRDMRGRVGSSLLLYALLVYPIVGVLLGHRYPAAPTFGLPCPTTIYTLGLLLWTAGAVPIAVTVIPLLWAVIGTSAALLLGVPEDLGLAATVLLTALCAWRLHRAPARDATAANRGGFHATATLPKRPTS